MATTTSSELALQQVILEMTSRQDMDGVLEAMTRGLVENFDAASALVWLAEDPAAASSNVTSSPQGPLRLAARQGLLPSTPQAPARLQRVVSDGEHYCTQSLPTDGSVGAAGWLLENGLRALAALPLTQQGEVAGVLAVFFRRRVDDGDFARLEIFSRTAAVALQNARLLAASRDKDRRLHAENRYLRQVVEQDSDCGEIVGKGEAIRKVLRQVDQVATTDATVLIQGETGTGKELVALAIHQRSRRRDQAMVKVNCGAISAGLVESELFGHEKGAFTGALEQRVGRFELADGGTLFLDEVGELPADTQVKLLRVLQEQELERVGSSRPIRVDVRVIAAGNLDLAKEVEAGNFRADLYYRLNVFPLFLPPLRQRREDIPLISACMLPRIAERIGKPMHGFAEGTLDRLSAYHWPGNVRELLNVLERAAILSPGTELAVDDTLLPTTAPAGDGAEPQGTARVDVHRTLAEVEREHIERVLVDRGWVIDGVHGAAKVLGLHANTLRSRMAKLGIRRP